MLKKILVTPRSVTKNGHHSLRKLENAGFQVNFCSPGRQPTEEELIELLPGCVGYLAGVEKVSARVLENNRQLKVISRNGTGVSNIDLEAAKKLNITICRAAGANARGVAELTICLVFSLVRSIPYSDAQLKNNKWDRRKGVELKGRQLGIIGCGRIGKEVACLALDIGMQVVAYDPLQHDFFTPSTNFKYVPMDDLLGTSDIISLHCPPIMDGKPLIQKETLDKMKTGAYLINTARGELIDDNAVLATLESGRLAGLAVDAFRSEPPEESELLKHERVIATPHIGGFTEESVNLAMERAVENLLNALRVDE